MVKFESGVVVPMREVPSHAMRRGPGDDPPFAVADGPRQFDPVLDTPARLGSNAGIMATDPRDLAGANAAGSCRQPTAIWRSSR